MTKFIDLTGRRFGRLTVLKHDHTGDKSKQYKTYWLCKCDCGNEKVFQSFKLKTQQHCGCDNKNKGIKIDYTGKRFGRLVVQSLYKAGNKTNIWTCRCDCGTILNVRQSNLHSGSTKSCGCLQRLDLIGKRFGRWEVLEFAELINNKSYFICKCDCGNIRKVSGTAMTQMKSTSCGCYSSELFVERSRQRNFLGEDVALVNAVMHSIKQNAERRKIKYNLSKEECEKLIASDCFYCGCKPSNIRKDKNILRTLSYNGIDRIDSSKGYEEGNVVPCCKDCNYGKRIMSQQDFLSWVERVYKHSVLKEK